VIEREHIVDDNMRSLARLYLRAKRLLKEMTQLQRCSWAKTRQEREAQLW